MVVAFLVSAKNLSALSHQFMPHEVGETHDAIVRTGLVHSMLACAIGFIPTIVVALGGAFWPSILLGVAILAASMAWIRPTVQWRWYIYKEHEQKFTSNVLEAVRKKMDAGQWTRYSDLRVDQRIAEVFGAIYQAWYNESRKGIFGSTPPTIDES